MNPKETADPGRSVSRVVVERGVEAVPYTDVQSALGASHEAWLRYLPVLREEATRPFCSCIAVVWTPTKSFVSAAK